MPSKVVTAKEEFSSGKAFGFQEGRVRIDRAYSTVDQADFKKNGQPEKFTIVRCEFTQLNPDDNSEFGEQEFPHFDIKVGDIAKFHPGTIASASDDEVTDMGDELEVEGNTLLSMDGKGPSDKSK